MAELIAFGQLVGGTGFPDSHISCRWKSVSGNSWKLVEGPQEGQTQLDLSGDGETAFWSHPIELHYLTSGVQGWPRFQLEVWLQDSYGRATLWSYGFIHLPSEPGHHRIECVTWRPVGSVQDQIHAMFTQSSLQLQDPSIISEPNERFRLQTEASGKVILDLHIVTRDFDKFGFEA